MASDIPVLIAEPSRSPSPSSGDHIAFVEPVNDGKTLSPFSGAFPAPGVLAPPPGSPLRKHLSPYSPTTNNSDDQPMSMESGDSDRQPFNFKPMTYTVGRPPIASMAAVKQAVIMTYDRNIA